MLIFSLIINNMHLCYLSDLTLADASNLVRLYTNDTTRKYLGGPLEYL